MISRPQVQQRLLPVGQMVRDIGDTRSDHAQERCHVIGMGMSQPPPHDGDMAGGIGQKRSRRIEFLRCDLIQRCLDVRDGLRRKGLHRMAPRRQERASA